MWAKINRYLPSFASAVLTAIDPQGYPASLRCRPQIDRAAELLRLDLPGVPALLPGPASLLYHSHDERLSGLRSCLVVGALRQDGDCWGLEPIRFVPGMGTGGPLGGLRFVIDGRRTAARYLARRGLARPQIDWAGLRAMLDDGRGER